MHEHPMLKNNLQPKSNIEKGKYQHVFSLNQHLKNEPSNSWSQQMYNWKWNLNPWYEK